jgi:hypothetical protein
MIARDKRTKYYFSTSVTMCKWSKCLRVCVCVWLYKISVVGYATPNDPTTNECYNEEVLSIKSGCYNERGGILSADVANTCVLRVGPSRFD